VDLVRDLPNWNPPATYERRTFSGLLQIEIDEYGRVERAAVLESIMPAYDSRLVAAAKTWRFQPATKDGSPVKYRKTISFKLQPPADRQ
jgi:TonB family protein